MFSKVKVLSCLMTALLTGLLLAGCASGDDGKSDAESASDTELSAENDRGQSLGSQGSAASSEEMTIETEYGNLQYPVQWREYVEAIPAQSDSSEKVSFTATISGERFFLFEVSIGDGDGERVGTITDGTGTSRDVFVRMGEISGIDGLTDSEIDRLYAMQEGVNDLIDNLR